MPNPQPPRSGTGPAPRARADVPADPRDLEGDFAHAHSIEVRFNDTDAMGHVNNAAYLTYAEIGRAAYVVEVTGEPFQIGIHGAEEGMILAEIRMTDRSAALYGEILLVETRVERIGRTSFSMVHRLTAQASRYAPARLIAVADSVLVSYDYSAERPIPVPASLADAIEAYEGRRLRS
ncbi:MAG: acyl-CoA thioesterase [Chloroflexi bacterium]|nr:acyl-CoA thioesterase [Chloroflexota bacterium]